MCHLDILLLWENVNDVVVSFNFALEEAIECFSEFDMSCISKLEPVCVKEIITRKPLCVVVVCLLQLTYCI